ncbi:hypothetical protein [Natronococcus jeotgali]|uniref:hypothetical protein n=1 Tax=Natronococcus jeotgali TaxID=413812 RepID=UPI0012682955|nr:hypothetical protein [Natronococcus jeotgali]
MIASGDRLGRRPFGPFSPTSDVLPTLLEGPVYRAKIHSATGDERILDGRPVRSRKAANGSARGVPGSRPSAVRRA